MSENKKDNVAKFPKGSSVNVEDDDAWVMRAAVVENLKNIIIIGDTVDGELMILTRQGMDEARFMYMLWHAMERSRQKDYEPPLEDMEIEDDDEGELEEADGEAAENAPTEDSREAGGSETGV